MPKIRVAGTAAALMLTNGVDLTSVVCASLHGRVTVNGPATAGTIACADSTTPPSETVDFHRSSVTVPAAVRVPYISSSLITEPTGRLGSTLAYPVPAVVMNTNWPSSVEYVSELCNG